MTAHESILHLKNNMSTSIIGQETLIDRLILVLLANGNMLLEGLPGLAKTRAIKSLAKEELDWSKNSKYGKKSNENFQKWLDVVAKKMHEQQVVAEDVLFTSM